MARLKDVSFIFLIKRENIFAGTIPSWEILSMFHLIPSAAARASFGCFFLCLSSSPPHSPLLFLVPTLFPSTTQSLWGGEGECAHPGPVWGGFLIQACCRHPVPSICTRYLIKPGIPRGFEQLAGREWALSPHLILTSAVIIPHCWQAKQNLFPSSPVFLEQEYSGSSLLHQSTVCRPRLTN